MYKETITYTDYDGNERTDDFYFNLTKAEIAEYNMSVEGGLHTKLERIVKAKNIPELSKLFKEIILMSYGEKSDDGKYFVKGENQELAKKFTQTEAYSIFYMKLIGDEQYAVKFINGVVPKDVAEQAAKVAEENTQIMAAPNSTTN